MSKTIPLAFLCVLFAQTLSALTTDGVRPACAQYSTGQVINADGTINLNSSFSGTIQLTGYRVSLDPCLGPVFQPLPPPSGWQTMGDGLNNAVNAVAMSGGNVYVGGEFTEAGGMPANYIAKWNGSAWSSLGSGFNNACYALAVRNDTVYAGGFFTSAGGIPASYVAMWNGSAWSAMGSGFNGFCFSLSLSSNNRLYAGGIFTQSGNIPVNYISRWNGNNWTPLGNGLGDACFAVTTHNSDVYAGGFFTTAGGGPASFIAKWDGNAWSALGSGLSGECLSLAFSEGNLYAGGNFLVAGGVPANRIARWNGSAWSTLGGGLNGPCLALAATGPNVLAGGVFTKAGGTTVNYVAWWDGLTWQGLGQGLDFACTSLAVKGGDVFVGGYFTEAGGQPANYVGRYIEPLLPVELISFTATVQIKQVVLDWTTLTETYNAGFYLERSADARQWTNLGFVEGQGTTQQAHTYQYVDKVPLAGVNYYRLRQEDFDGTVNYSRVVSASLTEAGANLHITPNPAGENVWVQIDGSGFTGNTTVTLFDAGGRPCLQQPLVFDNGQAAGAVDLSRLSEGVYHLRVVTPQDHYSARLVKH